MKKTTKEPVRSTIYRTTDLLKYKFGTVEMEFSPLSSFQKKAITPILALASKTRTVIGPDGKAHQVTEQDAGKMQEAMQMAMKFSIKSIKGVEDAEGNEYTLSFEENGEITEDCLSDLLNIPEHVKASYVVGSFLGGAPKTTELPEGISFLGVRTKK